MSFKIGPGVFTLGEGALACQSKMKSLEVSWKENIDSEEDIDLLDGSVDEGEDNVTHDASVKASIVQDIEAGGLVDFTWLNAGSVEPFRYVPNTALGREVNGFVRVVPITIGGEAKKRAEADFEWMAVGLPTLGNVAP